MLSTLVKRIARQAGFDLHRRRPSFVDLMRHHRIETVLDVGANEGQYALELREMGYRGRIISFEPIAAVHRRLEQRALRDSNWIAHNIALGQADQELTLAVSDKTVFSSFKRLSDYSKANFPGARASSSEAVSVARLDTWLAVHPLDLASTYLKIDTQGYEQEVLNGAGKMLESIRAVQVELPLRQLYDGQAGWIEIVRWMEERGFRTALAKENGVDMARAELLELDVVFINLAVGA